MKHFIAPPAPAPSWLDSLKFEDDVPLPTHRQHGLVMEALKDLKVGQSFVVPYTRHPIAANIARATGWKFTQAKEGDKLRIWRIK